MAEPQRGGERTEWTIRDTEALFNVLTVSKRFTGNDWKVHISDIQARLLAEEVTREITAVAIQGRLQVVRKLLAHHRDVFQNLTGVSQVNTITKAHYDSIQARQDQTTFTFMQTLQPVITCDVVTFSVDMSPMFIACEEWSKAKKSSKAKPAVGNRSQLVGVQPRAGQRRSPPRARQRRSPPREERLPAPVAPRQADNDEEEEPLPGNGENNLVNNAGNDSESEEEDNVRPEAKRFRKTTAKDLIVPQFSFLIDSIKGTVDADRDEEMMSFEAFIDCISLVFTISHDALSLLVLYHSVLLRGFRDRFLTAIRLGPRNMAFAVMCLNNSLRIRPGELNFGFNHTTNQLEIDYDNS